MDGVFESRKESFLSSLEKSISTISSDEYVKQMFQDEYSATYVPDRICELIRQILINDREDEINRLYNKLHAVEFFFDEQIIMQIENLGNKYITALNLQNSNNNLNSQDNSFFNNNVTFGFSEIIDNDKRSMKNADASNLSQSFRTRKEDIVAFCKILSQQIKNLGIKNIPIEKNEEIPKRFKELKGSIKIFEKTMYSVQNDFSSLLRRTKNQVLKIYQISTEKVKQEYVQKVKKAKHYINKQNEQIQQLSNSFNNMNDTKALEDSIQKLKEKLLQSKKTVASSQNEILSLQQQLLFQKNENAELSDKVINLDSKNRQVTEEINIMNNILNEKQQKIDQLEQSMMNIQNEILEQEQMDKIQQKVLNLNDTIRKIQNENDSLQKKSESYDKIISDLIHLTNTAQASDLISEVDRLCKEKVKISQILNQSVHSDASKTVEKIHQAHEHLKSILNVSDDSQIISEVQKLNEQKKSLIDLSEKVDKVKDVKKILEVEDENELKTKVHTLQRLKTAFDKLCLDCGLDFDNDVNSREYNLPETVLAFQRSYQTVKEFMSVLNLASQDQLKDILMNLVDVRNKAFKICKIFRIKNDKRSQYIPASKLVKIAKNLVKVKTSYDTIVSSLNTSMVAFNKNDSFLLVDFENFDEEGAKKAQLNARSFILMKSNLKTLCDIFKIDFKLPTSKVLSAILKQVNSIVKYKNYYQKILNFLEINEFENDEGGVLTFEKVTQSIHSLISMRKNNERTKKTTKHNQTEKSKNEKTKTVIVSNSSDNETQIHSILRDLCMIFKLDEPDYNSSFSMSLAHKALCSMAKNLQDYQSKNLSSAYNISIRLKHFKQALSDMKINNNKKRFENEQVDEQVDNDLRKVESEIIQIMNDLSNIFVCFGTSDYNEIKLAKLNFELQKNEIQRLSQITGKESFEESLDFLSKHFINIKQSSAFLSRLFRILLIIPKSNSVFNDSNSSILSSNDGIPLPIPRATQEKLLYLASKQNIEKTQLKNVYNKIIEKARSLGFSTSDIGRMNCFENELNDLTVNLEPDNNEIFCSVESALKFIIDNVKHQLEAKIKSQNKYFKK